MGIVAHIDYLHLTYLVYHEAIVAVIEDRRHAEDRVEHRHKPLAASHQLHQPRYVVED